MLIFTDTQITTDYDQFPMAVFEWGEIKDKAIQGQGHQSQDRHID